jgi:hypothetical protein
MNPALIGVVAAALAVGGSASTEQPSAGQPRTADTGRTALLDARGYEVTVSCAPRVFPAFGVKVMERDGRLIARFPGCEKELREPEAGVFRGEYCNSQPFQWIYQPGDTATMFSGTGGRHCTVQLARK